MSAPMLPGHARLLLLADFLEKLPPEGFFFGSYVGEGEPVDGILPLSCGATACALGWAASIPEIAATGYRLDRYGAPHIVGGPTYSLMAAAVTFDITVAEADLLFVPFGVDENGEEEDGRCDRLSESATALDVSSRIRELVAAKAVTP